MKSKYRVLSLARVFVTFGAMPKVKRKKKQKKIKSNFKNSPRKRIYV